MDSFRKGENLLRGELVREQINKLKKCPISEQFFFGGGGGEEGQQLFSLKLPVQNLFKELYHTLRPCIQIIRARQQKNQFCEYFMFPLPELSGL